MRRKATSFGVFYEIWQTYLCIGGFICATKVSFGSRLSAGAGYIYEGGESDLEESISRRQYFPSSTPQEISRMFGFRVGVLLLCASTIIGQETEPVIVDASAKVKRADDK
jgi:hypothetical protein